MTESGLGGAPGEALPVHDQARAGPLKSAAASLAAVLLACVGFVMSLPSPPSHSTTLAVVYPPWRSQAAIWQAAIHAGDVVAVGAAPFVLVLHGQAQDLALRAWRSGALLVLDAGALRACGQHSQREL